jgi:tRNA-dihydrouridine synthase B
MAEAAKQIEQIGFSIVDLNFECPIKRLVNRGEGGALMAAPERIAAIAAAVVRAVSIPVTLKIRSGPDAEHETAVEIARLAEQAGIAAVDVHARSVQQAYVGPADWSVVARVKKSVSIPVMGSGSIREASDVVKFLRETQADAVAIGRGCLGNPWIFSQARSLIQGGVQLALPSATERGRAVWQLVEDEFAFYGNHRALKRLPRTACYFAKWLPDFADFRDEVHAVRSLAEFRQLVRNWFR